MPVSTKLKALRGFLACSPPPLTLAIGGSTSTSTRRPTKYDMHLAPEIQLQKVKLIPTLMDDLLSLVDAAMENVHEIDIPFSEDKLDQFTASYSSQSTEMTDEASVADFYKSTTGDHCSQVAFWLQFRTPPEKEGIMRFTSDKVQRQHAIYDGAYQVNAAAFKKFRDSLPSKVREDLEKVLRTFPEMANWEDKGLYAAPEEFMQFIAEYAQAGGSFDWIDCNSERNCGSLDHYETNEPGAAKTVTGARMGFDASSPLCRLPFLGKRKSDSDDASYISKAIWEKIRMVLQQVKTFYGHSRFFNSDFFYHD